MSSLAYRRANFKRACDDCGHEWPFSKLKYIGLNRWVCPDDKGMLTREQYARHMAKPIPTIFGPRKHPKTSGSIGTYQVSEAAIFEVIRKHALSASFLSGAETVVQGHASLSVSACGVYLGQMIEEDGRPEMWISHAREVLMDIAEAMIAAQVTGSQDDINYGQVLINTSGTSTYVHAKCGETLLYAYGAFGDARYLAAAEAVAVHLRNVQCSNLKTSGANRPLRYTGAWVDAVNSVGTISSIAFSIEQAESLRFLVALRAINGGATAYGITAAGGDFSGPTSATLDTMIADAAAFYVTGLSTSSPGMEFRYLRTGGGGDDLWHLDSSDTVVTFPEFGQGIAGVFAASGYSAAVAAIYEWLMSSGSNPATEPGDDETWHQVENGSDGVYDPNTCPAFMVNVAQNINASSILLLATAGVLAPVRIASGRTLLAIKELLAKKRRLAVGPNGREESIFLGPTGNAALGGQAITAALSLTEAADMGRIYRHQPQSYGYK